ncbi:MAG TPA: GntR family transcriptional regulator [Spirochaetes bacterium]|nr:GntR family transcriptional regulator [Spirochaetota bacterium]
MEKTDFMESTIDKNSKVPIYKQVKNYLIDIIKHELRGKSQKLPPEMEISRQFNISRATVRIAIPDLVKDGLLDRVLIQAESQGKKHIGGVITLAMLYSHL